MFKKPVVGTQIAHTETCLARLADVVAQSSSALAAAQEQRIARLKEELKDLEKKVG